MNVLALDLSLTATGFCTEAGTGLIRPPEKLKGMHRLAWIRDEVLTAAEFSQLVVIEGYGFGPGRGNAAWQMGELGGVVRMALFDEGKPFMVVPPANLKVFATGKGNADKAAVLAAAIRRLGYEGDDHNEADAFWLYAVAKELLGEPIVKVPEAHRRALAKLALPNGLQDRAGRIPATV